MQNSNVLNFFGLREAPFNANLDPRFLLVTPHLEQAFVEVMDGIHTQDCFAVITGEVGTGKTTLLHCLRRRLTQQGSPTAFLFYTHLDRAHLLDFILTDFGIRCKAGETIDDWKRLENWLVERHCCGQTPVLLVDEAQGLPFSAFEEIRMLLNLETSREKLLQVVLAGEVDLEEKLKGARLRGLQQRITARCKTVSLNRDETFDYVRNRLHVGGAKSPPLFQPDAMDAIYFHSRGIPRVINVLCERALIKACADQVRVMTAHLIREVARALQLEYPRHLPATGSPVSVGAVAPAPTPRITAQELPFITRKSVLNRRPAVSLVLPSTEATEAGSEVILRNRCHSSILSPATEPVQESLENAAVETFGQRLVALSTRGEEKGRSVELANSSLRHVRTKFIRGLENQAEFSHSPAQPKNPGREIWQHAPSPCATNIKSRRDQSTFGAWWSYGSRPRWWKKVEAVVNLPRWLRRCDSLQRCLKKRLRPF